MENERLVFPLTRLPLVLLEDVDRTDSFFSALLKNRLMWLGFAVPLLLHSWNSLGNYNDLFQKVALSGSFSMLCGWDTFSLLAYLSGGAGVVAGSAAVMPEREVD